MTERVIKVAVLVAPGTRPEDLSNFLDRVFEDWDDVLRFTVEGLGWDGKGDPGLEERTEPLPQLLDCRGLRAELGVKRATAEAIMRQLPVVSIEGLRKTFVRRDDVRQLIDARTFGKDEVPT